MIFGNKTGLSIAISVFALFSFAEAAEFDTHAFEQS